MRHSSSNSRSAQAVQHNQHAVGGMHSRGSLWSMSDALIRLSARHTCQHQLPLTDVLVLVRQVHVAEEQVGQLQWEYRGGMDTGIVSDQTPVRCCKRLRAVGCWGTAPTAAVAGTGRQT